MNNLVKKILTLSCAAALVLSCSIAGCTTEGNDGGEEGTPVIFNYADGQSRPYTVFAEDGQSIEEPDTPLRTGYDFDGWYTAEEGGSAVTFPYTPSSETNIYAHWKAQVYDIVFDYNYEGAEPLSLQQEYNSVVEKPADPEREGYNFYYWQTQSDGGAQVNFPYTVKSDATFYAYWTTGDILKVVFNYNYEGAPEEDELRSVAGEEITLSDVPVVKPYRRGYVFLGWATSASAVQPDIEFPYAVTSNVTLYAVWEKAKYSVSFAYNYVDSPEVLYQQDWVYDGDDVVAPEMDPTREDYTFMGWYTTALGGEKVEFPLTVKADARYYAHWQYKEVNTNIFDAEFTVIDPDLKLPGYSGEAVGAGIIIPDDTNSAHSEPFPLNSHVTEHNGYYVSYQYDKGATITFVINSDKAVDNVTLKASLSYEILTSPTFVISPDGKNGYRFVVNGTDLDYGPVTIQGTNVNAGGGQPKYTFNEYTISTNVSLKQGENIIQLITNNTTHNPEDGGIGGTTGAVAPMVDYIKLDNLGGAQLSWIPVYDNIYR